MKKFRLVMFIGNCENFGTEWEELEKRVKIVEANSKEEVEEEYGSTIYDCDCKSFYIEELGAPCFKVIVEDECIGQFTELEYAIKEFQYCMNCCFENYAEAVGKVRIEVGVIE